MTNKYYFLNVSCLFLEAKTYHLSTNYGCVCIASYVIYAWTLDLQLGKVLGKPYFQPLRPMVRCSKPTLGRLFYGKSCFPYWIMS